MKIIEERFMKTRVNIHQGFHRLDFTWIDFKQ